MWRRKIGITLFYEEHSSGVSYLGQNNDLPPILRSVIDSPFAGLRRQLKVVAIDRVERWQVHVIVKEWLPYERS